MQERGSQNCAVSGHSKCQKSGRPEKDWEKKKAVLTSAGKHERSGLLGTALNDTMDGLARCREGRAANLFRRNAERLIEQAAVRGQQLIGNMPVVPLAVGAATPATYRYDTAGDSGPLPPIISLTSISGRIERIRETIECVRDQSTDVHSINLYISEASYLIDMGVSRHDRVLKDVAKMGVNTHLVPNIGPYRKQFPLIRQLWDAVAPPNTPVITIDDDVRYPRDVVERFMSEMQCADQIVAHRGRRILTDGASLARYATFCRPGKTREIRHLATGRNGVAYRLKHFGRVPEDFIGPYLAPTADDLWCRWVTGIRCIPTMILEPDAAYDTAVDFDETDPNDRAALFHAYNARGSNDDAMRSLETYFASRYASFINLLSRKDHG